MFASQSRGVTLPKNQGMPANEGPSNTVVSAAPCELVAVQYYDRDGRACLAVQWQCTPDAEGGSGVTRRLRSDSHQRICR